MHRRFASTSWLCWLLHGCLLSTALPVIADEPPTSAEVDVVYAEPTSVDRAGRILAPVTVNGQGPFRFILDTGANRSVLSPRLAEALQLTPSTATAIKVHGVTGTAVLPAVEVGELKAGELVIVRNKRMPVLAENVLADADGILGIEGLAGSRIEVDFAAGTVVIERSKGYPAKAGVLTVPASLRHGGLLMANSRVGRVRVMAIIDTGAERTLGNTVLQRALSFDPSRVGKRADTTVHGATPELSEGISLVAPKIYVGDAELTNLEVTFSDLHVFRLWGLEHKPALLIGMDLLGTVKRLVIDYRRREVQVEPWPKERAVSP